MATSTGRTVFQHWPLLLLARPPPLLPLWRHNGAFGQSICSAYLAARTAARGAANGEQATMPPVTLDTEAASMQPVNRTGMGAFWDHSSQGGRQWLVFGRRTSFAALEIARAEAHNWPSANCGQSPTAARERWPTTQIDLALAF